MSASVVHESILERNISRMYLGTVTQVSRYENPTVNDYVNSPLNPKEILFSVGNIITNSRAVPLELNNEVNVGDSVVIFSFELVYNNTFYYHPIRMNTEDNNSIYMKYGNSEVRLIPQDSSFTDLKIAGGKSVISFNTEVGNIRLDSDSGGIAVNSREGLLDIRNDQTSLKTILNNLVNAVRDLQILTPHGTPAGLTPSSTSALVDINLEISKLLGPVDDTSLFPNIPLDTYSVEYSVDVVNETSSYILNDEGDPNPSPTITNLQNMFPSEPEVVPETGLPEVSTITPVNTPRVFPDPLAKYNTNKDVKLTDNYWLSNLTTKALFPHRLKAQHSLSRDQLTQNLQTLALNVLEPIRSQYPTLRVNSGFRGTPSLPGGRVSQHEVGQAVDIQFPGFTPSQYFDVAEWVVQNVSFDQLIFEHSSRTRSIWLHISCKPKGQSNRYRTLTMLNNRYESGIKRYYN